MSQEHPNIQQQNSATSSKSVKAEVYLQFYIKLVRGVSYVKHFDLQFLPKGLREMASVLPNPEGWRLKIFELLAESTFKGLKPHVAKEQAYCYCLGFLGGVVVNSSVSIAWTETTKEDDKILSELAKPIMPPGPELSEDQQEKILTLYWDALVKKFFNTPYNTIENLAEIFRGLHDGVLAIPLRGEKVLFDSLSNRVHFILLANDDKIEAMSSVAEMFTFVQKTLAPEITNLDPDTFKKICQRIGLQGKAYKSMDTPIRLVP